MKWHSLKTCIPDYKWSDVSLDQSHLPCFTLLIFIIWFNTWRLKNVISCISARIRGYVYKVLGINSAILLHLYGYDAKIKNINNISLKFIMLTDNNQIFSNCFVIIYCHLTKVSSQINKCIIFEPNELSITLSIIWSDFFIMLDFNLVL